MKVLFCMHEWSEKEFIHRSGGEGLLRSFEKEQVLWIYRRWNASQSSESARYGSVLGENIEDKTNLVVVTDDMRFAGWLRENNICCVGYQRSEDTTYFPDVNIVLYSLQDLDTAFFIGILRRFHGLVIRICETKRLVIRESREEDFEDLFHISHEPGNTAYTETMPEKREEACEVFRSYISCQYSFYGFGLWTVVEKETGRVVGRCGLSQVTDADCPRGRIELGYLIGTAWRRRGYASEACRAILEYAFDALECKEITAVIHPGNEASVRLAEKLGFRKDGEIYIFSGSG